jgi:hypothetical protein
MWKATVLVIWGWGLLALSGSGGFVFAEPAALVLEMEGTSTPAVEPYTEILAPTQITLSSGAKLVFQHYQTCHTVTLTNGEVRIIEKSYQVLSGTKEVVTEGSCPREVRCSGERGCETAGVLLRSLSSQGSNRRWVPVELIPVSADSTFVLVGKRAGDFEMVQVKGPRMLKEMPLEGRWFHWPRGEAPLIGEAEYTLTFVPRSTEGSWFEVNLTMRVPVEGEPTNPIVLLRTD